MNGQWEYCEASIRNHNVDLEAKTRDVKIELIFAGPQGITYQTDLNATNIRIDTPYWFPLLGLLGSAGWELVSTSDTAILLEITFKAIFKRPVEAGRAVNEPNIVAQFAALKSENAASQ